MRARLLTGIAAGVVVCAPVPAIADDDHATITITPAAVATLNSGQLSVEPVGETDSVGDAKYLLPVTNITFTRGGNVKAIRLSGGVKIAGEPITLDLTNFRVKLPSQQATVRASSPDTRIRAFDVARLKVTKKKVSGVLLISPGTASVLNDQFKTYVFTDGLRFARFEYML
jgi:hypothetical protein